MNRQMKRYTGQVSKGLRAGASVPTEWGMTSSWYLDSFPQSSSSSHLVIQEWWVGGLESSSPLIIWSFW